MKRETVLITGANSFIAKHVVQHLQDQYHIKLLTRSPKADNEFKWDIATREIDERALDEVSHIIHLAGSKLNDGTPLTAERKELVYDSRIGAANFLRETLKQRKQTLDSFVSASAIGYYGFTDAAKEIDENGHKGMGFGAELSDDWEKAADRFKTDGIANRVVKVRVSIVLGKEGGIFPYYKEQVSKNPQAVNTASHSYVPWNHVEDMAGIFAFAVQNPIDGVFNSVAPEAASLKQIYQAIEQAQNEIEQDIPAYAGQHLVSHKIVEAGYQLKFPNIAKAVADIINQY